MSIKNFMLILGLCSATLLTSCDKSTSWSESIDSFLFELFGGTVFDRPNKISLKEIHLDDGRLQGKKIVVEGSVATVGDHHSYVIITDESARMLVLLNRILDADEILKEPKADSPKHLRVLGTVYKGKKGLPYISAISLNISDAKIGASKT